MGRILVVDDDPDILNLLSKLLTVQNHTVFRAEDAMKAMDYLNNHAFDLVISDARMPRFSGFELVRTIRNNKRFHNMAVAMLTSLREKKDLEQAIRAGVDDYIIKPIDPFVLIEKIEALFEKKPPKAVSEFEFSSEHKQADAEATIEVRFLRISEQSIDFLFDRPIADETLMRLTTPIWQKIQIDPPLVQVVRSLPEDEMFVVHASFKALKDYEVRKIRLWVEQQLSKGKVA